MSPSASSRIGASAAARLAIANCCIVVIPAVLLACIAALSPSKYWDLFQELFPLASTLVASSVGAGLLMFLGQRSASLLVAVLAILVQGFSLLVASASAAVSLAGIGLAALSVSSPGLEVMTLATLVFSASTLTNLFVLGWFIVLAVRLQSGRERSLDQAV